MDVAERTDARCRHVGFQHLHTAIGSDDAG